MDWAIDIFGVFAMLLGWIIIVYALWRNQRSATDSLLVETTNFGPRVASIVEVTLHPDHAAEWWRFAPDGWMPHEDMEELIHFIELDDQGLERYLIRVFPTIGMDSSEVHGIRSDDGRVT